MKDLDFNQLKQDFDRDGFILIRNYLSPEEVEEMRGHLDRQKAEKRPHLGPGPIGSMKSMNKDQPWFRDYLEKGRHIPLLKMLAEDDLSPDGVIWNDKPLGMQRTYPHFDALGAYRDPPSGISIWIALDEIDRKNGCLYYEKGSHKKKFTAGYPLPDYDTDNPNAVAVEVKPGDAAIHGALTVHWTNDKVDDRTRNSIVFAYWGASSAMDPARANRSTSAYKEGHVII